MKIIFIVDYTSHYTGNPPGTCYNTGMNKVVYMKFGSHLYGTNTPTSDLDFKGVFIADLRDIVLNKASNHIVEKTNKSKERNTKDDTDVEYKELRTFLKEAMDGQTYALDMLFSPDSAILSKSPIWDEIIANRHRLLSKNLKPFIGYCRGQAIKYGMKGDRLRVVEDVLSLLAPYKEKYACRALEELFGAKRKPTKYDKLLKFFRVDVSSTPPLLKLPTSKYLQVLDTTHSNGGKVKYLQILERKYDFKQKVKDVIDSLQEIYDKAGGRAHAAKDAGGQDFKALSHAYRCIYELEELMTTGKITFPLLKLERVMAIKTGKIPYDEMNSELAELIERVVNIKSDVLPDQPDRKFWEEFILKTYGLQVGKLRPLPLTQQDLEELDALPDEEENLESLAP